MSEDVKSRILDAAKRLFAERGYDATSVRQICEEAGANVALVSYHFGGKEKLLLCLCEQFFPGTETFAEFDEIEDPIDRVKQFIKLHYQWKRRNSEISQIVYNEMMLQSERRELLQQYVYPVWKRLQKALREAREQERLQFSSLDVALLYANGTLTYPHHANFFDSMLDGEQHTDEELIRTYTRYILLGLGANTSDID
ncbi:MAG TPA: TetR family transcriptional regulator [Bacilli bacterium]|nr:TetR family transcriptional regulator [Bacilli bacterium]